MPGQLPNEAPLTKSAMLRLTGCGHGHKRLYETVAIAKQVAAHSLRDKGITLRVYKCRLCRHYHLTKQVPRKAQ